MNRKQLKSLQNKRENPWPVTKELSDHMAMRQKQHREKGLTKAENWFFETYLIPSSRKWRSQARWGFRLFDFWNHNLGCAVEVDGPEHNQERDLKRDFKEWERSRIVVIRVRNWNKLDAEDAVEKIKNMPSWNARRLEAGMDPIKEELNETPHRARRKKRFRCSPHQNVKIVQKPFKNGSIHFEEKCLDCGLHFRLVPFTEINSQFKSA